MSSSLESNACGGISAANDAELISGENGLFQLVIWVEMVFVAYGFSGK
jgi:hypothetical protein